MTIAQTVPALAVLFAGVGLYIWVCVRFPPALALGVVVYSMISKSASVAYLETVEVYLIEVDMVSHLVGASAWQIFYNLFIFAIALAIVRWVLARKTAVVAQRVATFGTLECNRDLRFALNISATLLAVQILNAILSPPYALPGFGVDRQQFWANIRFPLAVELIGVLVLFVPAIAGVALAYGKLTHQHYFRRFSVTLMLAYGFFFLLTGARFHGSLIALLFWLSAYWTVLWACGSKPNFKRMGALLTVAVGAFLVVGYLEIADRGISEMTGSAWNGLLYRAFALQGSVYFAADVLASEGQRAPAALLKGDMTTTVLAYMPPELADAYLDKGVNLAGSLPGNSILVFGHWLGLVPMAVYAILLGLIASIYIYAIASGRFILVLPLAYMCLWTYGGYFQGSFSTFLSYKFYLFALLMIYWLLFQYSTRQYRRPMRKQNAKFPVVRS